MYTMVERRKANRERMQETVQLAQTEFFPKIQAAPGFVGFYLVADEANGINTAVAVFESKAHFDEFDATAQGWWKTLDEMGHTQESLNRGETIVQLEPQK